MEQVVMEMCRYILNNLDNEITIDKMEEVFCYNKFYLIRVFKMYTGYTIKEFMNNVKVLKTIIKTYTDKRIEARVNHLKYIIVKEI